MLSQKFFCVRKSREQRDILFEAVISASIDGDRMMGTNYPIGNWKGRWLIPELDYPESDDKRNFLWPV